MPRKRKTTSGASGPSNGLREALLGLLAIKPMSGYDVTRSYTHALQQIWYAPQGQVYPTLRRMHSEGLLHVQVEVQSARPNRKVYSLTSEGRRSLAAWLSNPAELPRMHHEFIHKLFLLNHVESAMRTRFVDSYIARSQAWSKELRRIEKKLLASLDGAYAQSARFQLLALQHLIRLVDCEAKSAQAIAVELSKQAKTKKNGKTPRSVTDRRQPAFAGLSLSPVPAAEAATPAPNVVPYKRRPY